MDAGHVAHSSREGSGERLEAEEFGADERVRNTCPLFLGPLSSSPKEREETLSLHSALAVSRSHWQPAMARVSTSSLVSGKENQNRKVSRELVRATINHFPRSSDAQAAHRAQEESAHQPQPRRTGETPLRPHLHRGEYCSIDRSLRTADHSLSLQSKNKKGGKVEKADILEIAVARMKQLHAQSSGTNELSFKLPLSNRPQTPSASSNRASAGACPKSPPSSRTTRATCPVTWCLDSRTTWPVAVLPSPARSSATRPSWPPGSRKCLQRSTRGARAEKRTSPLPLQSPLAASSSRPFVSGSGGRGTIHLTHFNCIRTSLPHSLTLTQYLVLSLVLLK